MSSALGYTPSVGAIKGTRRWFAIELLQMDDDTEPLPQNEKSDVWAFGMTVYELLTQDVPYKHIRDDVRVMLAIAKGKLPSCPEFDNLSSETPYRRYMWYLCNMCWKRDPRQRPDMTCIAHEVHKIYNHIDPVLEMDAIMNFECR